MRRWKLTEPWLRSTQRRKCYTDRMKYYFVANDVTNCGKNRSILLAACGPAAYKIIRNLVEETKMDTTSFEEIVKLVKKHFEPAPSAIT